MWSCINIWICAATPPCCLPACCFLNLGPGRGRGSLNGNLKWFVCGNCWSTIVKQQDLSVLFWVHHGRKVGFKYNKTRVNNIVNSDIFLGCLWSRIMIVMGLLIFTNRKLDTHSPLQMVFLFYMDLTGCNNCTILVKLSCEFVQMWFHRTVFLQLTPYLDSSVPPGWLLQKWNTMSHILHSAKTLGSHCCGWKGCCWKKGKNWANNWLSDPSGKQVVPAFFIYLNEIWNVLIKSTIQIYKFIHFIYWISTVPFCGLSHPWKGSLPKDKTKKITFGNKGVKAVFGNERR